MERNSPRRCVIGNFLTGLLVGIFTVKLADGRMDVTDDRNTVSQMLFLVTSQVGQQTDKSCNLHTDGHVGMTV